MYGLLYLRRGMIFGAGYTDVHATLPVLRIVLVLMPVTALLFLVERRARPSAPGHLRRDRRCWRLAVLGGKVYPEIIQRFVVTPNEIDKETPLHRPRHRIHAPGLRARPLRGARVLRRRGPEPRRHSRQRRHHAQRPAVGPQAAAHHLRAAPGNPHLLRLRARGQRPLLDQWRLSPGLALAARARHLQPAQPHLDQRAPHLHARLRAVPGPRERIHQRGPAGALHQEHSARLHDLARRSRGRKSITARCPTIIASCNTEAQEFDYPAGDKNVYTNYQGEGGIPVEQLLAAAALCAALRRNEDPAFQRHPPRKPPDDLPPGSRPRRAPDALPALRPRPLHGHRRRWLARLDAGRLHNLRQVSLLRPDPGVGNYIRNSVKATINAYTGQVHFYISDPTDPLIQVYSRIFPGVFRAARRHARGLARAHPLSRRSSSPSRRANTPSFT